MRLLSIEKDSIRALLINVAGVLFLFLYHIITARLLSVDDYGRLSYVVSLVGLAGFIASLGLSQGGVRLAATYLAARAWGKLRGLVVYGSLLSAAAGVLLAVAVNLAMQLLVPAAGYGRALLFASFAIPGIAVAFLLGGIFRGMHAVAASVWISMAVAPALLLLSVLGLQAGGTALSLNGLALLYSVAYAATALAGLLWIAFGRLKQLPTSGKAEFVPAEVLVPALPILFSSLMVMLFQRSDVLLLGTMSSAAETALYSAAAKLAVINSFVINAVNVSASPVIAVLHHEGRTRELQATLDRVVLVISGLSIGLFVLFVLFSRQLLALYGSAYEQAVPLLVLLSLGQLFNALCGLNGSLLVMSGNERVHACITTITAVINIAAQVLIIPRYGAYGAAVVTVLTTVLWNVLMAWAAWKRTLALTFIRPSIILTLLTGNRSR